MFVYTYKGFLTVLKLCYLGFLIPIFQKFMLYTYAVTPSALR